jgi:hypothetical protein
MAGIRRYCKKPSIIPVQSNNCAQRTQQVEDQMNFVAEEPVTLGRACISLTSSNVS